MRWRDTLVVLLLAMAVGMMVMAWANERETRQRMADAQQRSTHAARTADSLAAVLAAQRQQTAQLHRTRDSLARVAASRGQAAALSTQLARSLRDSLTVVQQAADSLPLLVATVDAMDAALDSTTAAATSWALAYGGATQTITGLQNDLSLAARLVGAKDEQIAALQDALTTGTTPPCRLLGLPCPSRSLAFAAGAVLTLALIR